jgi:hypothetical protein
MGQDPLVKRAESVTNPPQTDQGQRQPLAGILSAAQVLDRLFVGQDGFAQTTLGGVHVANVLEHRPIEAGVGFGVHQLERRGVGRQGLTVGARLLLQLVRRRG